MVDAAVKLVHLLDDGGDAGDTFEIGEATRLKVVANALHFGGSRTFTGEARELRGDLLFDPGNGCARDHGHIRDEDRGVLKRNAIDG
jgi:hypothetical protein